MKKEIIFLMAALILVTVATAADVPHMINYQGCLTDTGGEALDTTVTMAFTLYNAATLGTQLWTETQPACSVREGLFNVLLGSVNAIPDSVFADTNVWLGITVGTDSEMSPRKRVVSVAYAYRVGTVDGASGGTINGKLNVGLNSTNTGDYAFVSGSYNHASGDYSVVAGGGGSAAEDSNSAAGFNSFIGGGASNVCGQYSVVGGGHDNNATGEGSSISGGRENTASGIWASVSGGLSNEAGGDRATVGGGNDNEASEEYTAVGGGWANKATGYSATVAGGSFNEATGAYAMVGGGCFNYARGSNSVVAGGGKWSPVDSNLASGSYSAIGGGVGNEASGGYTVVGGGWNNETSSNYAVVPGGRDNTAQGDYSFAAGRRAKANHNGCFVWGDATDADITTSNVNQIRMRGAGGTIIYSNAGMTAGVRLSAGGNGWIGVSDSTKKRNIRLVDTEAILDKVSRLPIKQWSYKSQDPNIEHIGPMAQDFWKLFHLGEDSLGISTIDPDGIALAAIQELHKENQQLKVKTDEIEQLKAELRQLKTLVQTLLASHRQNTIEQATFADKKTETLTNLEEEK